MATAALPSCGQRNRVLRVGIVVVVVVVVVDGTVVVAPGRVVVVVPAMVVVVVPGKVVVVVVVVDLAVVGVATTKRTVRRALDAITRVTCSRRPRNGQVTRPIYLTREKASITTVLRGCRNEV